MANPVAWFEVTGPDGAVLQDFYSQLFDWKIDATIP
jgi:predicted enzyme related to lactoylglutathione lyase